MKIPQLALALVVLQVPSTCGLPEVPGPGGDVVSAAGSAVAVGSYTLRSVNGRGLPFRYENDDDCRESITGGTLNLRGNGTYRWAVNVEENCEGEVERETETEEGRYDVRGKRIRFDDEFEDEDESEEDDGYIDGASVRVHFDEFGDDPLWLTFTR